MAPSDVKRFVAYLDDLSQNASARAVVVDGSPKAAGTDFEETLELLQQFEDDDRVRRVLLDPTDATLRSTLATVQEALDEVEATSIAAYIDESPALSHLHEQIYRCDADLGKAEGRLSHFDAELSTVNEEMHTLEADSDRLAVMLRNRIAAAESLAAWLQDTTVMPALVRSVRDGDIGDGASYARSLAALQAKMANMHAFVGHEKLRAFPELQALEAAAVQRVKDFLTERIAALKPSAAAATSNATIRRQGLIPFAPYCAFLRAHAPAALEAVRHRYCSDSRGHLALSVKTYLAGLSAALVKREKCLLVSAADLAEGGLPSRLGHMFLPSSPDTDHLADFELGSRPEELLHPDFSRWPARALRGAETARSLRKIFQPLVLQNIGKRKVAHEYVFKSVLHQLCNAAAGEFVFLEQFFGEDAEATFDECWHPVLAMVHHELDAQLAGCFDVIGVLIMTRVVSHCQLLMAHAQVPVFGSFLDRLGLMLWPHFSRLIREQISSISLDKDNSKARGLKPPAPAVLPAVRRWAALFAALGQLNAEYNDSQVHNNLDELARAVQPLLYRIRLLFPRQLDGAVFHILNLQHIVAVLHGAAAAPLRTQLSSEVLPSNSGGLGDDAMATCRDIETALALVKTQYKEEVLGSHLKELMAYLSQAQAQLAAGKAPAELEAVLGGAAKPRKIVLDFKDRWKAMVSVIQKDVLKHFVGSAACQAEMSRACLEELYKRFKDFVGVLGMQGGEFAAAAKEGPSMQTVAFELRELVR